MGAKTASASLFMSSVNCSSDTYPPSGSVKSWSEHEQKSRAAAAIYNNFLFIFVLLFYYMLSVIPNVKVLACGNWNPFIDEKPIRGSKPS